MTKRTLLNKPTSQDRCEKSGTHAFIARRVSRRWREAGFYTSQTVLGIFLLLFDIVVCPVIAVTYLRQVAGLSARTGIGVRKFVLCALRNDRINRDGDELRNATVRRFPFQFSDHSPNALSGLAADSSLIDELAVGDAYFTHERLRYFSA